MTQSRQMFFRAKQLMPGGGSSPVRAFKAVGGEPLFFKRGVGPYLIDVDDKKYIDYVGGFGPMILGHGHPSVVKAIVEATSNSTIFGANCEVESLLATKIIETMPAIEMVRFVNSGTEASMTALRLARAYSGRNYIIKFDGCYHGHEDSLLVKAGSGVATLNLPGSSGVPPALMAYTLVADFNDLTTVNQLFAQFNNQIAAVVIEPVMGNVGCIPPKPKFLQGLRKLCDQNNSLLIFDEVMTGFRVGLGGAQAKYQVYPDITLLGKIIGGGLPVGALGARKEIMECLAPVGDVYQAGTFSGNPMTMKAGLATLNEITSQPDFYHHLTAKTTYLVEGIIAIANQYEIKLCGHVEGGMFSLFFTDQSPNCYKATKACNQQSFNKFFHAMLDYGIYLPPSAFESCFVSSSHDDEIIAKTLVAVTEVFKDF